MMHGVPPVKPSHSAGTLCKPEGRKHVPRPSKHVCCVCCKRPVASHRPAVASKGRQREQPKQARAGKCRQDRSLSKVSVQLCRHALHECGRQCMCSAGKAQLGVCKFQERHVTGTLYASEGRQRVCSPGEHGWVIAGEIWPGQVLSFLRDPVNASRWRAVKARPRPCTVTGDELGTTSGGPTQPSQGLALARRQGAPPPVHRHLSRSWSYKGLTNAAAGAPGWRWACIRPPARRMPPYAAEGTKVPCGQCSCCLSLPRDSSFSTRQGRGNHGALWAMQLLLEPAARLRIQLTPVRNMLPERSLTSPAACMASVWSKRALRQIGHPAPGWLRPAQNS